MSSPDLVRRAAERLAKQSASDPQSGPRRTAEVVGRPDGAIVETPLARASRISGTRTVTISPTTLAQHRIHLPSAESGFDLTIEEYRSIRRHVVANFKRLGGNNQTLMVTSARPGDGKTFTTINLALSLAFSRQYNVLLMDADARRRSLINNLGIKADAGWIDLLQRPSELKLSDVVLNTNISNLAVLPSGVAPNDLPELIGSQKMVDLIAELNSRDPNGILIMNSLPCLVSNEPALLAEHVGQIIFVVAANETGRDEVQTSLGYLSGCPMVSMVLNKGEKLMSEQFTKYGYEYNYDQAKS